MKKTISTLLIFVLVIVGLAGCGKSADLSADKRNGKLTVVATIFPGYDFVRAIGGEHVNLSILLPPGAESHSFEPTAQDMVNIQNSDLFLCVGGESETWVNTLLNSVDTSDFTILSMMDVVETVEEEIKEGMEDEDRGSEGLAGEQPKGRELPSDLTPEEGKEYDEHVWTSPQNAIYIVEAILAELCRLDPEHAAVFQANANEYIQQLTLLDGEFRKIVEEGSHKTLIFGDRFPFRYFADAYGLDYYAAFPGCSAQTEASAKTIAFLIEKVKAEKIPVVFHIEFSNEKMADTICEDTGAKKLLFHSCHNVTKNELSQGVTYLDLMRKNAENLKEAI